MPDLEGGRRVYISKEKKNNMFVCLVFYDLPFAEIY